MNEKAATRGSVFLTEGDENSAFYVVSPDEIASMASEVNLASEVLNPPGGPIINEEDPYIDTMHQSSERYSPNAPSTDRRKELEHRFK